MAHEVGHGAHEHRLERPAEHKKRQCREHPRRPNQGHRLCRVPHNFEGSRDDHFCEARERGRESSHVRREALVDRTERVSARKHRRGVVEGHMCRVDETCAPMNRQALRGVVRGRGEDRAEHPPKGGVGHDNGESLRFPVHEDAIESPGSEAGLCDHIGLGDTEKGEEKRAGGAEEAEEVEGALR